VKMKMNTRLLAIAAAAALSCGLLAGGGEALAAGLSCTGVPVSGVSRKPISCTVTCASGGSINAAVAYAPYTTAGLAITINGTCTQTVNDLGYSHITFQGGSSGGTILAPSASTNPVVSISGQQQNLNNLTISGGVTGLQGNPGAQFNATNLVIEGASSSDLLMNFGANAVVINSTIKNSAADGIDASDAASVGMHGGVIEGNAQWGANVGYTASLAVYDGAAIENNGDGGGQTTNGGSIYVTDAIVERNGAASGGLGGLVAGTGGHVFVSSSTASVVNNAVYGIFVNRDGTAGVNSGAAISGNGSDGIHVEAGGAAVVRGGSIIESNGGNGIYLESGNVTVGDGTGPATIENNKSNGIFMRTNSVATFENSGNQIINNTGWGILCAKPPANPLIYGLDTSDVSGNKAGQISCKTSP
jgi:hypothetical protein